MSDVYGRRRCVGTVLLTAGPDQMAGINTNYIHSKNLIQQLIRKAEGMCTPRDIFKLGSRQPR